MAEIERVKQLFLWCMSVVYLFAFSSLFVQIPGLYGENGILPARLVLDKEANSFEDLVTKQPTLLRLLPKVGLDLQTGMDFLCFGGMVLAFVAMTSQAQRNCVVFAGLWVFYLSLFQIGQIFLWFQWDIMLLEAGFLTILVAPMNVQLKNSTPQSKQLDRLYFWLLRWLLFRVTFASGVVRLLNGVDTWWNVSELGLHYETQGLPLPLSWLIRQAPGWIHRLLAALSLTVQILTSVLVLSPFRSHRKLAAICQIALISLTSLTGNYSFLTVLLGTLCLSVVEDDWFYFWPSAADQENDSTVTNNNQQTTKKTAFTSVVLQTALIGCLVYLINNMFNFHLSTENFSIETVLVFARDDLTRFLRVFVPLSVVIGSVSLSATIVAVLRRILLEEKRLWQLMCWLVHGGVAIWLFGITLAPHTKVELSTNQNLPSVLVDWYSWSSKLYRLTSPYSFINSGDDNLGRLEVIIEGSYAPSEGWKEYNFRYKPGDVTKSFPVVAPHQPRLDWQLWLAARGGYGKNPWLLNLIYRLFNGQKEVLDLMGSNPFPVKPPNYIRATLYLYQFTTYDNLTNTRLLKNSWWTRKPVGEYIPVLQKDDPSLLVYLQKSGLLTSNQTTVNASSANLLKLTIEAVRSILGQFNGLDICLSLLTAGMLLTVVDIKWFESSSKEEQAEERPLPPQFYTTQNKIDQHGT